MKNFFYLLQGKRKAAAMILLLCSVLVVSGQNKWSITNPYEKVDWSNDKQYKACLHTHTTRSDGWMAPQEVVDRYRELGYSILAITDHNAVTWPWTSFSEMEASTTASERVAKGTLDGRHIVYENRDAQTLKMVAIQGNELSRHHHMGSYFTDHNLTPTEEESLQATSEKDGLIIMNHPGRYTSKRGSKYSTQWYADMLNRYPHIAGIEIYNQGDRYPGDRQLYDSVLTQLMPSRNVWAYSNDDMHRKRTLGKNWNVFILPELSEEGVRQGMTEGRSFYVYSPLGGRSLKLPEVEQITVDRQRGTIEITVSGKADVRWISGGKVVAKGTLIDLNDCPNLAGYVRAEIYGTGNSITGTQPFGIEKE